MAQDDKKKKFKLLFEKFAPASCAILGFIGILIMSTEISEKFSDNTWKSEGLYSAIFNWSAIQIGFAFGVYGFVVGRTGGFIEKIKETLAMRRFMGYVKRANIAGFLLTISSIPLIICEPKVSTPLSLNYVVVSIWFSLFVWSFLSFLRLAFNFGRLASVKDEEFWGA